MLFSNVVNPAISAIDNFIKNYARIKFSELKINHQSSNNLRDIRKFRDNLRRKRKI